MMKISVIPTCLEATEKQSSFMETYLTNSIKRINYPDEEFGVNPKIKRMINLKNSSGTLKLRKVQMMGKVAETKE